MVQGHKIPYPSRYESGTGTGWFSVRNSGSPIFLQDRQFKAWRLCDIFVAAWVPNTKARKGAILALKPEHILQAIERLR